MTDQPHTFSDTDPDGPCTDECVATHPDHAGTRGDLIVLTKLAAGDGGKDYGQITIGDHTITVYESLSEPGRVVIDVDGDPAPVAIAVNDDYVHGGPANRSTEDEPQTQTFTVEVIRSIASSVTVTAADEHDAVAIVDRAEFPLPPIAEASVLDGWEYIVYDESGDEVYRTD